MAPRMHAEIEKLTPVFEKISSGISLEYDETYTLNSVTEKMIRDIFEWIQEEKKLKPTSDLVLEKGLYSRFVNAYGTAREKNEKLKVTYTENIKSQLTGLSAQVSTPTIIPPTASTGSIVTAPISPTLSPGETVVYPDKQKSFADALTRATTFPFIVRYSESGKLYEVTVTTSGDTILVGSRAFKLHNFAIDITNVGIDTGNIVINGDRRIPKADFIKYISENLNKKSGTYNIGSGLSSGKMTIAGDVNPNEITGIPESLDTGLLAKINMLKVELEKRIKEGLTPVELAEGLKYISDNVRDEPTKQMAINYLIHMMARDYTIVFDKDGSLNIVPKDVKNTATAATYQNALHSSLLAKYVSVTNIQESMTMLTGQKWSDYARTIADPKTASAQGYAKYLADTYGLDIEKKPVSQIQGHKSMVAEDKAWLLSYLNGQMSLDVAKTTGIYQENLKSYQTLIDSPFFAVLNKATGSVSLTPAQAQAAAEAAARGSSEGGDGKGATWALGILAAIVGLGFKKGEGWSLWTSLKRIFMGGLAVGGVMLGCAAGREWKKELGMDLCAEAKKALKEAKDEMLGTSGNTPAPAPATAAAQQAVTAGPAMTIDTTKLSPQQKKGVDFVMGQNSQLPKMIEDHANKQSNTTEKGKIQDYINFIHSDAFQNITLESLMYNKNQKITIFSNNDYLDPSIAGLAGASNLNKSLLKKVIMMYILGTYDTALPDQGKQEGDKELEAFKAKYAEGTYKGKKFHEFIAEIHK